MASRSGPGAAAAAAVAAAAVGQPGMDLGVVILAAAVAGLAAGVGAAAVGVAILWTWGRKKGASGVVASGKNSKEAVWAGVNGNAPTTTAAEAAAAAATAAGAAAAAAAAGTPAAAPTPASAPDGEGRRLSMNSWHEADLTPPLPADVVRLLQASRLCFLSTFCDDHPHLSLMNFTYHPGDEVIILSTRRDTKKYKLVQTARHVAILVHEFPDTGNSGVSYNSVGGGAVNSSNSSSGNIASSGGSGSNGQGVVTPSTQQRNGKVTITLNGSASIQEGALAEKYRALHAQKNPDSKTFIVGPNIAIITVRVRTARICNVRDEVTLWDVANPSNAN